MYQKAIEQIEKRLLPGSGETDCNLHLKKIWLATHDTIIINC